MVVPDSDTVSLLYRYSLLLGHVILTPLYQRYQVITTGCFCHLFLFIYLSLLCSPFVCATKNMTILICGTIADYHKGHKVAELFYENCF